ncbi:hypothetical protein B0H13DRAFT_1919974 [Mycena leptocephala]|nr:hypothetical protein B0H13DRAFT_1919974 [Mycena leptocephala]
MPTNDPEAPPPPLGYNLSLSSMPGSPNAPSFVNVNLATSSGGRNEEGLSIQCTKRSGRADTSLAVPVAQSNPHSSRVLIRDLNVLPIVAPVGDPVLVLNGSNVLTRPSPGAYDPALDGRTYYRQNQRRSLPTTPLKPSGDKRTASQISRSRQVPAVVEAHRNSNTESRRNVRASMSTDAAATVRLLNREAHHGTRETTRDGLRMVKETAASLTTTFPPKTTLQEKYDIVREWQNNNAPEKWIPVACAVCAHKKNTMEVQCIDPRTIDLSLLTIMGYGSPELRQIIL